MIWCGRPSRSFGFVLDKYIQLVFELRKETGGRMRFHFAYQIIRRKFPLEPIRKLILTMKHIENTSNQSFMSTGIYNIYKYLEQEINAYFYEPSHYNPALESVTLDLRKRFFHMILRELEHKEWLMRSG